MKSICILLFTLGSSVSIYAQKQANNWYFGTNAGISFNSGAPVAITTGALNAPEGCASISDASGNLLFYTDGVTIYMRNHAPMFGGTGLAGSQNSAQSAIIIQPYNRPNIYNVFTIADWTNPTAQLRYSVVDMSLNGGLGQVIITNNFVVGAIVEAEGLAATAHANCEETWVVTHDKNRSYYARPLQSGGSGMFVQSPGGARMLGTDRKGGMRFSPDGKKLCNSLGGTSDPADVTVELASFDNATGLFSNYMVLGTGADMPEAYSSEFSPDNTKLYVASWSGNVIYQFDLTQTTEAAIRASRTVIASGINVGSGLQMGPDKKIYVTGDGLRSLNAINQPNELGTACNFQINAVNLGGKVARRGLPNFVSSYFNKLNIGKDTAICNGASVTLNADSGPGSTYLWNNGATTPSITVSTAGQYSVQVNLGTPCEKRDTIRVTVGGGASIDIGPDTTICGALVLDLDATVPGPATYAWSDGLTFTAKFKVPGSGKWWVDVTQGGCKTSDTIVVAKTTTPTFDLGPDTTICSGAPLLLRASGGVLNNWLWQDGSTAKTFNVTAAGKYYVRVGVINNRSCFYSDTINVSYSSGTAVDLGRDTALCIGSALLLDATAAGAIYRWQDGSVAATFNVPGAGKYWVDVDMGGCKGTDTVLVTDVVRPSVKLGNDTAVCNGTTVILNAYTAPADTYKWQDGSTASTFNVGMPGKYWVDVMPGGNTTCKGSDTIVISYGGTALLVNLGRDTALCSGNPLVLDASATGAGSTFVWQDGTTAATFNVPGAGKYWVDVKNSGCSGSDTLLVTDVLKPFVNLGNDTAVCGGNVVLNAFTAPGDTYKWQDGSTGSSFTATMPGKYWVDVMPGGNTSCLGSDTLVITSGGTTLAVNLGKDTVLCSGAALTLDATTSGAGVNYKWQDASTSPTFTVPGGGKYWVDVTIGGCAGSDTLLVTDVTKPIIDLGNDTAICAGTTLVLNPTDFARNTYQWQDATTSVSFNVTDAGTYWVEVAPGGNTTCASRDTIDVAIKPAPVLSLGNDTTLCAGTSLLLNASTPTATAWLWQDGSAQPTYRASSLGNYSVEVTTTCGVATDTILVKVEDCNCQVKVPNSFSPNHDFHNDVFKPLASKCGFAVYELKVFNIWGERIFETSNPSMGWDGSYKGQVCNNGTYVYILHYKTEADPQTKVMRGTLLLVK